MPLSTRSMLQSSSMRLKYMYIDTIHRVFEPTVRRATKIYIVLWRGRVIWLVYCIGGISESMKQMLAWVKRQNISSIYLYQMKEDRICSNANSLRKPDTFRETCHSFTTDRSNVIVLPQQNPLKGGFIRTSYVEIHKFAQLYYVWGWRHNIDLIGHDQNQHIKTHNLNSTSKIGSYGASINILSITHQVINTVFLFLSEAAVTATHLVICVGWRSWYICLSSEKSKIVRERANHFIDDISWQINA